MVGQNNGQGFHMATIPTFEETIANLPYDAMQTVSPPSGRFSYTHTHVCVYIYIYVCVCVCVCECVCVCVCESLIALAQRQGS